MEKVEQDRHISNHDIGKELNINQNSFNLEKAGYQKNSMFVCHMI